MHKVWRKLKKEQIERGVIFSSTLSNKHTEQPEDTIHEVFKDETDAEKTRRIGLLKDDKFFNDSPWNHNIIRR